MKLMQELLEAKDGDFAKAYRLHSGILTFEDIDTATLPKISFIELKNQFSSDWKVKEIVIQDCQYLRDLKSLPKLKFPIERVRITNCRNLESLEGLPLVEGYEISIKACPNLKSLNGINTESVVKNVELINLHNLSTFEGLPTEVHNLVIMSCYGVERSEGFGKLPKFVNYLEALYYDGRHVPKHLLAPLKIKSLERVELTFEEVTLDPKAEKPKGLIDKDITDIINDHLPIKSNADIMKVQSALLDIGADEYAEL